MSDDEDAVAALLDELAEAPPDDALDAAAERLAEDALAAACAEELEDAAARDVVNEAVVDAAADRIVESAIKTAGNEIDAADEALAASATELLIEHAIIDAAAETDDQDDRTSADTVARVQTEVATTIIEGAIDTLKDDDTLKEAFMEAVDARAAALASHALDAAREALAADARARARGRGRRARRARVRARRRLQPAVLPARGFGQPHVRHFGPERRRRRGGVPRARDRVHGRRKRARARRAVAGGRPRDSFS